MSRSDIERMVQRYETFANVRQIDLQAMQYDYEAMRETFHSKACRRTSRATSEMSYAKWMRACTQQRYRLLSIGWSASLASSPHLTFPTCSQAQAR